MKCKPSVNINLKHKKGLWSPDEDQKLRDYILNHGVGCWSSVPINAGLQRNGKSCRLRWINYLRPGLKRGMFTTQEEQIILTLHGMLGNKWSQMSRHLPGRSDNEIKNHWHSYLKKKHDKLEKVKLQSMPSEKLNEESSSVSSFKSVSSCLESSRKMEKVSVDLKIPRKILFADWISLDGFNLFDNSDELSVSGEALYPNSSSQETTINGESRFSNLQQSPELNVGSGFYDLIFEENIHLNFNINDARLMCSWDDDLFSASTSSQSNFRTL